MEVLLVALSDDLHEIRALIESAGYGLAGEFVQHRRYPDPKWFVGKGKLEELKTVVKEKLPGAVVFAGALRANQHHALEKALQVQCFDRVRVILDIFTQRAHGREAKLQVELAMLHYEIPILKEWIHSASIGERPGFMSGGEYSVDAYYNTVKRKMKKVQDDLQAVRSERAIRRDRRQDRGFDQVSLAGYANAGKSSLFNALSGESVLVDDRLFTTLSTTTRTLPGGKRRVLLTDTVGFVSDVPLWLVDAFRSTFEEVFASDLVLLAIDASDSTEDVRRKVELAVSTLVPGIEPGRVQPVLTKADRADAAAILRCRDVLQASPFTRPPRIVSTKTKSGLDELRDAVLEEFQYPLELTIHVPNGDKAASFLNWLHERTDVLSVTYPPGGAEVHLRCRERDLSRIEAVARVLAGPSPI